MYFINVLKKKTTSPVRSTGFTLIEILVVIAVILILAAILFPVFARAREQARKSACQLNLKQIGLAVAQYTQDFDEKYPTSYNRANPSGNRYWYEVLDPYVKSAQLWVCPTADQIQFSGGYGWNIAGTRGLGTAAGNYVGNGFGYQNTNYSTPSGNGPVSLAEVDEPSRTIQVVDPTSSGYPGNGLYAVGYGDARYVPTLHGGQVGPFSASPVVAAPLVGGGNYLFADGHVKMLQASQALSSAMWDVDKEDTGMP